MFFDHCLPFEIIRSSHFLFAIICPLQLSFTSGPLYTNNFLESVPEDNSKYVCSIYRVQ